MFAVFVSTLSAFRWSRNHRLFFHKPQQSSSPMMMSMMMMSSMTMMIQECPSTVTLSKLDANRIHPPLPPPPKQKLVQKTGENGNKNDTDAAGVMQVVHWSPDYGGIDVRMMIMTDDDNVDNDVPPRTRILFRNGNDLRNSYLSRGDGDDEVDFYYLVDDDVARNPYNGWDDDQVFITNMPTKDDKKDKNDEDEEDANKRERKQCRKTSWQETVYPNCNTFHEFDFSGLVADLQAKYLG
jgi:hypothetical protein